MSQSLDALPLTASPLLSCVLALLNSNLELTIWSASKNLVTGEWIKVGGLSPSATVWQADYPSRQLQDVTSVLKSAAAKVASSASLQTLRAQCTCALLFSASSMILVIRCIWPCLQV